MEETTEATSVLVHRRGREGLIFATSSLDRSDEDFHVVDTREVDEFYLGRTRNNPGVFVILFESIVIDADVQFLMIHEGDDSVTVVLVDRFILDGVCETSTLVGDLVSQIVDVVNVSL